MAKKYILAHDMGTGGSKVVLYGADGTLIAKAFNGYETLYPKPRWAEQRPEDWWKAIVAGTQRVVEESRIDPKEIAVISLDGHGMGNVPVDADGTLLRESAMVWFDSRSSAQAARVLDKIGLDAWYRTTGCAFEPAFYTGFKLMWYRDHEPEMFDKTHHFLGTKDFIVLRMTGSQQTDPSDAGLSGFYDIHKWEYSEELLRAADFPIEKLPDVYPSTHVAGELLPAPAAEMGLPAGIPVVVGGEDVPCTAAGAGVVTGGRVYTYIGTSGWMSVASDRPLTEGDVRVANFCHIVPGMYTPQMGVYSAGSTYQWVQDNICRQEVAEATASGEDPFVVMERLAAESPAGADGLLFLNTFAGGGNIHEDNPDLKGAYIGLGPSNTRANLVRAAMEGVSLDLGLILNHFRSLGLAPEEMRLVGGGGKSPIWRQTLADVFATDVLISNIGQEAAALGAAMIGGVGVGLWNDFGIVDSLTETISVTHPDPDAVRHFEQLLPIFRDAVAAISGICSRLAAVTRAE
jgi:xylulokinase